MSGRANTRVFLLLTIGNVGAGRIVLEVGRIYILRFTFGRRFVIFRCFFVFLLFFVHVLVQLRDEVAPKTCENFRCLCTGTF